MFSNNDSIGKTFFVVIALCLVCAILVATAAVQLRPKQVENKLLDSQKNVLAVTGLLLRAISKSYIPNISRNV